MAYRFLVTFYGPIQSKKKRQMILKKMKCRFVILKAYGFVVVIVTAFVLVLLLLLLLCVVSDEH